MDRNPQIKSRLNKAMAMFVSVPLVMLPVASSAFDGFPGEPDTGPGQETELMRDFSSELQMVLDEIDRRAESDKNGFDSSLFEELFGGQLP